MKIEEADRVRVALLPELATRRESLAAAHQSFQSVCPVEVDGDAFRRAPRRWEY